MKIIIRHWSKPISFLFSHNSLSIKGLLKYIEMDKFTWRPFFTTKKGCMVTLAWDDGSSHRAQMDQLCVHFQVTRVNLTWTWTFKNLNDLYLTVSETQLHFKLKFNDLDPTLDLRQDMTVGDFLWELYFCGRMFWCQWYMQHQTCYNVVTPPQQCRQL